MFFVFDVSEGRIPLLPSVLFLQVSEKTPIKPEQFCFLIGGNRDDIVFEITEAVYSEELRRRFSASDYQQLSTKQRTIFLQALQKRKFHLFDSWSDGVLFRRSGRAVAFVKPTHVVRFGPRGGSIIEAYKEAT